MSDFTCFKCGDGRTPLYCLNCANEIGQSSLAPAMGSAINVIGLRGDIKDALGLLKGEYVQRNMHCMGAIGAQDVAIAITALEDALRKLPNDQGEP